MNRNPIVRLQTCLDRAREGGGAHYNAMALSTVAENGQPSVRFVLLRGLDDRGLIFYTSYLSRKGRHLESNARAAAVLHWPSLGVQVTVEGNVTRLPEEESDAYFASRPRGHQLGAWASEQSETLESREVLEQRFQDYDARFEDEVPRPHSWGGYILRPERVEFWESRENRLHDRLEYTRSGAAWVARRLQP